MRRSAAFVRLLTRKERLTSFQNPLIKCHCPCQISSPQDVRYNVHRNSSHDTSQLSGKLQDTYSFLETLYSMKKHGVLTIESGCREFCHTYRTMDDSEKLTLLCHIAENYGVNQTMIVSIVQKFLDSKERGEVVMLRLEDRMRGALSAKYQLLFSDIGRIDGGVKFLVDMRADILRLMVTMTDINKAHMTDLQQSLKEILSLWFTVGFLTLERITWKSSCDMLQKISEYEAVHPVRHWQDLKRRVGPYRRCFVFTHSSMPEEPIVVLHCALTKEISSSIHSIIGHPSYSSNSTEPERIVEGPVEGPEDPSNITTAMFYSISSTQKGDGIPQENETSNPVQSASSTKLLTETDIQSLCDIANVPVDCTAALQIFREHVSSHTWVKNKEIVNVLKEPLMRLCARYLYLEKKRAYALDSVANFHLQNGAVLWRLNYLADSTLRGLTSSCGLMVNYRYYLEDTVRNSQEYIEHQTIHASKQILELCGQIVEK